MKNRREFLKIFGMVTAAGAALATVGVVSAKSAPGVELNHDEFMKALSTPLNARARVTCPAVRVDAQDEKGIDGEYEEWRKVWAILSGVDAAAIKEAKERDDKIYGRVQNVSIGPDTRQQMVDNVFAKSPLFEYLKVSGPTDSYHPLTTTVTHDVTGGAWTTFTSGSADTIKNSVDMDIYQANWERNE